MTDHTFKKSKLSPLLGRLLTSLRPKAGGKCKKVIAVLMAGLMVVNYSSSSVIAESTSSPAVIPLVDQQRIEEGLAEANQARQRAENLSNLLQNFDPLSFVKDKDDEEGAEVSTPADNGGEVTSEENVSDNSVGEDTSADSQSNIEETQAPVDGSSDSAVDSLDQTSSLKDPASQADSSAGTVSQTNEAASPESGDNSEETTAADTNNDSDNSSTGSSGSGITLQELVEEVFGPQPEGKFSQTEEKATKTEDKETNLNSGSDSSNGNPNSATTTQPIVDEGGAESVIDSTGEDSTNSADSQSDKAATIENDNELTYTNEQTGEVSTGGNKLSADKLEGTIETGSAGITSKAEVKGNNTQVNSAGSAGSGNSGAAWPYLQFGAIADIGNTGEDSQNLANSEANKSLSIINRNKALINNQYKLKCRTGENTLEAVYKIKNSKIETGACRARAELLNLVNTNQINSKFLPLILEVADNFTGDINLLDLVFQQFGRQLQSGLGAEAEISDTGEDSINAARAEVNESLKVDNENEGYIYNSLELGGVSGENTAIAGWKTKNTKLKSGDVLLSASIFDFLNINLINTNWIVAVINIVGDWAGNIIVPKASDLDSDLPGALATDDPDAAAQISESGEDSLNAAISFKSSDTEVVNDNDLNIGINLKVDAETGDNQAQFTGKTDKLKVKTGQAKQQTVLSNLTNLNIFGTALSQIFFNNVGQWSGSAIGLPSDAIVRGDLETSFMVTDQEFNANPFDGSSNSERAAASGLDESEADGSPAANISGSGEDSINLAQAKQTKTIEINNQNKGTIIHDIKQTGISGRNKILAHKGANNEIETGAVNAVTTIADFMNINITGSKVMTLMVNVLGNWQGNLSFGPVKDLAAGISILNDNTLEPGEIVTVEVSATNLGTENISSGEIEAFIDTSQVDLVDSGGGRLGDEGGLEWSLSPLAPDEIQTFYFKVKVKDNLPPGKHYLRAFTKVRSPEDQNLKNNFAQTAKEAKGESPTSSNPPDTQPDQGQETEPDFTIGLIDDNQSSTSDDSQSSGNSGGGSTNSDQSGNSNPAASSPGGGGAGSSSSSGGGTTLPMTVDKYFDGSGEVEAPGEVIYHIVLQNNRPYSLYDVVVYDKLEDGDIVFENSWPLGEVYPNEKIVIDYQVIIAEEAENGAYTNNAYASGFDGANTPLKSNTAQTTIKVVNNKPTANGGSGTISTQEETDNPTLEETGGELAGEDKEAIVNELSSSNKPNLDSEDTSIKSGLKDTQIKRQVDSNSDSYNEFGERVSLIEESVKVSRNVPKVLAIEKQIKVEESITTLTANDKLALGEPYSFKGGLDKKDNSEGGEDSQLPISFRWLLWLITLILVISASYYSYKYKVRMNIL